MAERPAWAGEHDVIVDLVINGVTCKVPPSVKAAYENPFASIQSLTEAKKKVFACFDIKTVFVPAVNTLEKPTSKHVNVKFVGKEDDKIVHVWNSTAINASKLLEKLMKSDKVSDQTKLALAEKHNTGHCTDWKRKYDELQEVNAGEGGSALKTAAAAAKAARTGGGAVEEQREQTLEEMGAISRVSTGQVSVIRFFIMQFFFMCRIPFEVIDNYFFRVMIEALHPAFAKHLPKSKWLRTNALDDFYEECVTKTDKAMDGKPGKMTLGIDGKTDRRGRGVMNITQAKVGRMAYVKSIWFRRREHNAETHAEAAKEVLGDGSKYRAIVADNTGVMPACFRILKPLFKFLFYLGCCVHVLDLLVEDIARIEEIAGVIAEYHFLAVFVKEYSLIFEAFLELQVTVRRHRAPPLSHR